MRQSTTTARAGQDAQIMLGDGWKQFAFKTTGLDYLGTIRRGMGIGALAQDEAGRYWQVNGDIRQALNTSRVAALMRAATVRRRPLAVSRQPTQANRAAVSVTVKPRRRVLLPAA